MTPIKNPKINDLFFCDDFRKEDNGKGMAIGIYNKVMAFPGDAEYFPFVTCLLVTIDGGQHTLRIKFETSSQEGVVIDTAKAEIKLLGDGSEGQLNSILVPIFVRPMKITGANKVSVKSGSSEGKNWKTVGGVVIKLIESPTENARPS